MNKNTQAAILLAFFAWAGWVSMGVSSVNTLFVIDKEIKDDIKEIKSDIKELLNK